MNRHNDDRNMRSRGQPGRDAGPRQPGSDVDAPGNQDYSNRYSTPASRGEWRGHDYDRYGGAGGGRIRRGSGYEAEPRGEQRGEGYGGGYGGGAGGYEGGYEDVRERGGGYAGGYRGQVGYQGSGGASGGQYGGDYGGGRPWQDDSYNEYESENRLPPISGGANMLPQAQGGGRYTSAGYSSGFTGARDREFGASYGRASGYGDQQPRYVEHGRHDAGEHEDWGHSYARGAGGGAFGSGYAGEYGGPEPAGEHRGRGPRGYTRSDERLKEDICERLTDDPHIDASEVEVEVDGGIVTLTGTIHDRAMKYRTEELIDRCSGVRDIRNQLALETRGGQRGGPSQRGSGDTGSTRDNEFDNDSSAGSGSRKNH